MSFFEIENNLSQDAWEAGIAKYFRPRQPKNNQIKTINEKKNNEMHA